MSGRRRSQSRGGMVLIVVLVVVVLLSLAAYAFVDRMASEQKAVRLHAARVQSRLAAESGAEYVMRRLVSAEGGGALTVDVSDNAAKFCAVRLLPSEGRADNESTPAPRFTVIAPLREDEAAEPRYGLLDESARLNLHALAAWDAEEPGAGRRALMALPEMTPAIADRILDYVDADAEPREQGFEPTRSGPPTIEGLLMIEGVTPALLLGGDRDRNGRLDPLESGALPPDGAAAASRASLPPSGWSAWLTLSSAESALTADGSERIDLNSNDLSALHTALVERFDETVADFVVAYRQFAAPRAAASEQALGPRAAPADGAPRRSSPRLNDRRSGPAASSSAKREPPPSKGAKEKKARPPRRPLRPAEVDPAGAPPAVLLRSAYDLVDAVVQVPATGQRAAGQLKSPWRLDEFEGEGAFARLLDETTTQAGPLVGRVNLLQAPRVVLQAVGLEPRVVDAVLEGRGRAGSVRSDRGTLLWLVREKHLNLAELQRVAPRLTTRGHVATAQVIGFVDPAGPVERYELTVDATVRPPRRLSWKSLAPLGRGYPASVLDPWAASAPAASRPPAPPSLAATP